MKSTMVPKKSTRSCAEATAAWVPGSESVSDKLIKTASAVSGVRPPARAAEARKASTSATLNLIRRLFAGGSLHSPGERGEGFGV